LKLSVGLKKKLEVAFNRTGWTPEQVDRLCEGDTLKRVRDEHVAGVKSFRPEVPVFCVTEGDGKSAQELIAAGNYFYVDPSVLDLLEDSKFQMSQVFQDVVIELLEFSSQVSTAEIRRVIMRSGYQPATFEDAMRLGAKYSNDFLRTRNGIIFTNVAWADAFGRFRLLSLWMTDHRNRTLTGCVYEGPFEPGVVVAVRKRIVHRIKF